MYVKTEALRWLARYAVEKAATVADDVKAAADAFSAMPARPEDALLALQQLVCSRQHPTAVRRCDRRARRSWLKKSRLIPEPETRRRLGERPTGG